ncbi:MAG: 3-isopropylmalate dehydratase large subunit, partial [Candidatus Bathyarchaeia archaeon]
MCGMTITEKILAYAAGLDCVKPGDIVDANVDMAMVNDITGSLAIKMFKRIGLKRVWDNQGIVLVMDHQVPGD